ncbi:MAG: hypothetical protein U9O83_02475, partial [Campylobacterota bacterium]|nr:hypothetical protein [Campylobacterota bacterium]
VFAVILFVLYPKDLLKEQILSEKSNYDLSMLYLKNLLEHSPEDESLMLILAEQSLRSGKRDLSLRLLNLLLKSKDKERRHKATLLSYELKKDDYNYFKNSKKRAEQKKELRKLFFSIFYEKMYNEEDIERWYKESIFLQENRASYYFLKQKISKDPKNMELLESAYYLSIRLGKSNDSIVFIDMLIKYDIIRRNKWLLDKYYMLINAKRYTAVESMLKEQAKNSILWKKRFADYYLLRKSFIKASNIYIELFNATKSYSKRKEYLLKAINALQAGNHLKRSAALGRKYEKYYINDRDMRKFLLKLYMATGYLDYASTLSKKILKKEMQ